MLKGVKKSAALLTAMMLTAGLTVYGGCPAFAAENENAEASGEDSGDRLDEILERGYIIVGTEGTYSPNSYHDEDDNLVGFDVEVAALIAKYMGVEVQYMETEWASIFAALDAGQIDMVVNEVGYTEERAEKYDMSEPYAFSRRCILVKGDNEDITSFEDLEGHVAANESTSIFGQTAEEYGAELDPVNAMAQSISEVLNGRADCTLNYETAFNDYIKEHPEADVKIVAYADPEPSSYVPVVKGNEKLIAAVNDALKQARESGELAEVSKKYFNGLDVTVGEDSAETDNSEETAAETDNSGEDSAETDNSGEDAAETGASEETAGDAADAQTDASEDSDGEES